MAIKVENTQIQDNFRASAYITKPNSDSAIENYFIKLQEEKKQKQEDLETQAEYANRIKQENIEHEKVLQEALYVHSLYLKAQDGDFNAIKKLHEIVLDDDEIQNSISASLKEDTINELNKAKSEFIEDDDTYNDTAIRFAILEEIENNPEYQDITEAELLEMIHSVSSDFKGF